MDDKTRQKKIKEILDKIDEILFKDKHDYKKDIEAINKLLDEAKQNGLI